ncbi:MAG TPA: metal ABC transporter substrate-binding protein [Acidimicrobiales bacterium]
MALVALLSSLVGCGASGAGDGGPLVVATHSILGDLATNVLGDTATVQVVMPAGTDPHDFEPSAADVALLSEADLVVANGLGFEVGLTDALEAAADDGIDVLDLGEQLDPLPLADGDGEDPHWFTDPRRTVRAVGLIAAAAAAVDGIDAAAIGVHAEAYVDVVTAADAQMGDDLLAVPAADRRLVTNHEVFGYFADRYGFEVIGTIIPSGTTLAEPSSADLSALVDIIDETGVPAIFADTSSSRELADVLAEETGEDIAVVELFSESLGEPGSGGETYLQLIRTNADRIVGALA